MLFPLRRIWSSFVIRRPSGVISLHNDKKFCFTLTTWNKTVRACMLKICFYKSVKKIYIHYTYNSVTSSSTMSDYTLVKDKPYNKKKQQKRQILNEQTRVIQEKGYWQNRRTRARFPRSLYRSSWRCEFVSRYIYPPAL